MNDDSTQSEVALALRHYKKSKSIFHLEQNYAETLDDIAGPQLRVIAPSGQHSSF